MRRIFCDWCETEIGKNDLRRDVVGCGIEVKVGCTLRKHIHLELCQSCALAGGLCSPKGRAPAIEKMVKILQAAADKRRRGKP